MKPRRPLFMTLNLLTLLALLFSFAAGVAPAHATSVAPAPPADHTPDPISVAVVGSLQSEASGGACGDWDPACAGAFAAGQGNLVYLFNSAPIPAGAYEYKVALNGSWAENYGGNFQLDGPNIALNLAAARAVRFYYDHKTHYIADNVRNTIYTIPGSFNDELGCSGDWQPECLRTFMSDVDGDGVFTFVTEAIPAGSYEFKVATNESWSNPNYGDGGGPNNIAFTVPGAGFRVAFTFNTANNAPGVTVTSLGPKPDNNVEWDGVRHDSRDLLYRTPGGAVTAGTPVTLRLRTFHNDVTAATLRVYSVNANGQSLHPMALEASDVSCYEDALAGDTCDYWTATLMNEAVDNIWYRFLVTDGTDTDYYADNTPALDGGPGAMSDEPVDNSYALTVYEPNFTTPAWAKRAYIYQIFPDRFRNARTGNDPRNGQARYDDPVIRLPWGTLPEGYCRNYADAATNCPWRFDATPPDWSPTKEGPRGRDYFGGDLLGVTQKLSYLDELGVSTLYFNPIFAAKSNHRYDTADYMQIDPNLGTFWDYQSLVRSARNRGMNIVLDGVYNHMSSDSPTFDRYRYYSTVGACESASSAWRTWFYFRTPTGLEPAPCVPSTPGGADTYYNGWFGFDSIPVINKDLPSVQQYFLTDANSVTRFWLRTGIGGWRMDVMGDSSFPAGYWETFRQVVKGENPNAVIISETWQKDTTLLRMLRGDRADTTMNYRMRDAVIGYLSPNAAWDSKGFADSGRVLAPSEFLSRLASIQEDTPAPAYYTMMNLLGSHDTERIRWTLTPGQETRQEKELNLANVSVGRKLVRMASLIQFTQPGAPTVYYGDEIGLTGDDDPDDRRTFPWNQAKWLTDLRAHYKRLASLRKSSSALIDGDFRPLLADDQAGTAAYGRKSGSQAALVALNRSPNNVIVTIPVAGYLPDGVTLAGKLGAQGGFTVLNGQVSVALAPQTGALLMTGDIDLTPTDPPAGLAVTNEGDAMVSLSWGPVAGAASYNVYRSPVSGGGWVKVNAAPVTGATFTDTGLENGRAVYYAVTAVDAAGNESAPSDDVAAIPHYQIGWANLQWPPTMNHTISVTDRTDEAYGQVWIDGVTGQPGPTPTLMAQLGFGPAGSNPQGNAAWTWVDAGFNVNAGNNDEFKASMLPQAVGAYDYVYRYSTTGGRDWLYADLNGPVAAGAAPANPGKLTVSPSGDTTAPATPANLLVTSTSPFAVNLAWTAVTGDATLYGYEVLRSATAGGPYATIATVTTNSYGDATVAEGASYYYVVRALDTSFNRSGNSNEVSATAAARTVSVTFNVTAPDTQGRTVHIAGTLSRLDGGLGDWNPGGVALTKVNDTLWTITLTGKEGTQIEYKYALGSWDYVEKDNVCGEVGNRMLTLAYGANWRNVAPCGN
ncbi:MAG: alpha-amylase family glycosyl hydrolase [Anaerolineae bacterium]|nr:alpha-amylase family glycosyl hydrolase [Anaerolineae bacterium]